MIQLQNIAIGTDLLEINRIKNTFTKHDKRFAKKILSKKELKDFSSTKAPVNFLAKRFAAKEAAVKALGTGFSQGVSFKDISLYHNSFGAPYIKIDGKFAEIAEQKKLSNWQISLSDTKDLILAFVVAI